MRSDRLGNKVGMLHVIRPKRARGVGRRLVEQAGPEPSVVRGDSKEFKSERLIEEIDIRHRWHSRG